MTAQNAVPGTLAHSYGMLAYVARAWGHIRHHHDGRPFIDFGQVKGKRRRVFSYPVADQRARIRTQEEAERVRGWVQSRYENSGDKLQALGPFLTGEDTLFLYHWHRFIDEKRSQGNRGLQFERQLSSTRLRVLAGHEGRGYLEPLLELSIYTLSYGQLEDWRNWLFEQRFTKKAKGDAEGRHLSARSVRHVVNDVGACLRWLGKRGEISAVPAIPTVQVPEHAPKIPSPKAQERILAAIDEEIRGLWLARAFMGLRPSEARRASGADWDRTEKLLRVMGKGGRYRLLPVDAELQSWLEAHPPAGPFAPLFTNPKAHPRKNPDARWMEASERRVWVAACRAAFAEGVTFKPNEGTRHAFATHTINRKRGEGEDAEVSFDRVGAFMGHTDTRTTRRYGKLATGALVDVLRKRPKDA